MRRSPGNVRDNDIVAIRQPDGRYVIRRWLDHHRNRWAFIERHTGTYDEDETRRRLDKLRSTGATWMLDRPNEARRVE